MIITVLTLLILSLFYQKLPQVDIKNTKIAFAYGTV